MVDHGGDGVRIGVHGGQARADVDHHQPPRRALQGVRPLAEDRLEVDEVARQSAREGIVRLHPWVDEQLLDADLQLIDDLTKAPYALPAHLDHGAATD